MDRKIWPADWLHAGFFTLQIILLTSHYGEVTDASWWMAFNFAALGSLGLIILRTSDMRPRRAALWRLLHGFLVIPVVFTEVGVLTNTIRAYDYAAELEQMDRALFGFNPLEALEAWENPFVSEVMQWAYNAYIVLPVVAMLLLAWKGSPVFVARSLFSLLAVFFLSYVGYYLVPASGPNIHNNFGPPGPCGIDPMPLYRFTSGLPGVWLKDALKEWMWSVELTKRDCFPSGHVAAAVACAAYAARLGRGWGIAGWVIATGVVLSTVYLRYHYVVDVIAGLVLAALCVTVLERWHRRFEPVR